MMKLRKLKNKVVNCKTEYEAKEFLKIAEENGYKWFGGFSLSSFDFWDEYEKNTCYDFFHGIKKVKFCDKKWYKKMGYKVLSYKKDKKKIFKKEEIL